MRIVYLLTYQESATLNQQREQWTIRIRYHKIITLIHNSNPHTGHSVNTDQEEFLLVLPFIDATDALAAEIIES